MQSRVCGRRETERKGNEGRMGHFWGSEQAVTGDCPTFSFYEMALAFWENCINRILSMPDRFMFFKVEDKKKLNCVNDISE